MICKRLEDKHHFNYRFVNDAIVELDNPFYPEEKHTVSYETWCKDYLIVNKWDEIKINDKHFM